MKIFFFLFYFSFNPFDGWHLHPRRWLFGKRMVIAWYGVARTVVSAFVGFFLLLEVGKEEQSALGCAISFSQISLSIFSTCMVAGMMFMPNLGAAYEAWCFFFSFMIPYDKTIYGLMNEHIQFFQIIHVFISKCFPSLHTLIKLLHIQAFKKLRFTPKSVVSISWQHPDLLKPCVC
jgi:hypothetical protein